MENLYETITLCKAKRIDACMQTFDAALTDAETCGDMMMRQLLPAFRKKFGKKLTTPGLIKWCIEIRSDGAISNQRASYYQFLKERLC